MLARFNIQTVYTSLNNKDVRDAARHPDNAQARIEYVSRYFKSSWFAPFGTEDETRKICDEELTKLPQHNFFNYARAQLENNEELKKNYLMAAAKSCMPCGPVLSAQAAYDLSIMLFPEKDELTTPSIAWLSKALILKNDEALQDFLANNFCKKGFRFGLTPLCCVFLTTYLSGVKISGLEKSRLLKDRTVDTTPFIQAYHYPLDTNIPSRPDSPVIKILELLIARNKSGFVTYFCYCMQHEIISEDTFRNLINFYLNSGFTDHLDFRQDAISIIVKHKLLDKFAFMAPQASTTYFAPTAQITHPVYYGTQASAPLATNYNSSYYYMYAAEPQMVPAATQMPVPEYHPSTSVPATPYNSPVSSVLHQREQSHPQPPSSYTF